MNAIPSTVMLERLEIITEKHIRKAIEEFQNLDEGQLLAPAPDGGWSIAQCLDHLNGYGDYYYPLMETALSQSKHINPEYKPTWLGNYFTKMLDPDTGKKKMKAFKKHVPAKELDARRVVAEFISQGEHLLQMLRNARGKDLNRIKIPISLTSLIKMNLGDTFRFLVAHNERHMRQALGNEAICESGNAAMSNATRDLRTAT